jgi:hypothetical protein
MRITVVKRGGKPPVDFCPWMICVPPEDSK